MPDKVWNVTTGSASWGTAGNWTPSGVPVTGDVVYITQGDADIDQGLAQSAVTLAALYVYDTFTGTVGTSALIDGDLDIGCTLGFIGVPSGTTVGAGSGRIKINTGTVA